MLAILCFSSLITLVVTGSDLYLEYRAGVATIHDRLRQVEISYAASLGESLWKLDKRQIALQLRGIAELPDIRLVELQENAAVPIRFSVAVEDAGDRADDSRDIPVWCNCGGTLRTIGVLHVEATHANLYRDIFRRVEVILAGQAVKTFLVATFILFVVHRMVTRHLLNLAGAIAGFTPGEGAGGTLRRPLRRHPDEFDAVLDAFNAMGERLERRSADLRAADARMQAILDNIPDLVWFKAADGRFIAGNRPLAKLLGVENPGALVGRSDEDFSPPDLAQAYRADDEEVMRTRAAKRLEEMHVRQEDGSRFLIETVKTPLFDGNGDVIGTVGIARDISDRRAMEEALRETATRLEALIANQKATVFRSTYAVDGPRLSLSFYGATEDGGRASVAAAPRDLAAFRQRLHPEDEGREFETIGGEFARSGYVNRPCRTVGADGTTRWYMVRERVVAHDGDVITTEGLSVDISEEMETRRMLEAVINNLPGSVFRLKYDADGNKRRLFMQGGSFYRRPVEQNTVIPRELYHPDDRHMLFVELPRLLMETGQAVHTFRTLHPDGTYRWLRAWERVIERMGDEMVTEGIALDVDDEMRAKEAYEDSQNRFRQFVDALPVGVFEDEKGKGCIYASGLWMTLTGLSYEEILGTGWVRAVHPDDLDRVLSLWQQAVATLSVFQSEYRLRHLDGRVTWVMVRAVPRLNPDGSLRGYIGSITDIGDRKRMEEALRTSEEGFRTLAENLPDMVVRIDRDTRFLYATPLVCETYGRSRSAIIGRRLEEVVPVVEREQATRLTELVRRAFAEGRPNSQEVRWHTPAGEMIADVRHVPERNTAGEVISVLGISRDITQQKLAEEELRRTAQALETTLSNLPGTVFRMFYPASGLKRLLMIDGAQFRGMGALADAVLAMTPEEFAQSFHPDEREFLFEELPARLRHEGAAEFTQRIPAPEGGWVWQRTWERVVERIGDDFITEGITLDVTEEIEAKRLLEKSEQHFGDLVESLPVGVFEEDGAGRCVFVSSLWTALTGRPASDLVEESWRSIIAAADLPWVDALWHRCVAERAVFQAEFRLHHAGTGGDTWVLSRALPRLDEDGNLLGYIGSITDISDRKVYEGSLERLNHVLRTVTAGNEALMQAPDKAALFEAVCQVMVKVGGHGLAWIGLVENDARRTVRPVAWAGENADYISGLEVRWDESPLGRGPTGSAVRTGLPQMSDDIATDPCMAPWREEALRHGFRSTISLPLKAEAGVMGCINIYSDEVNGFSDEEARILLEFANNIAFTVVALRERRLRAEMERHLQQAQKMEALGLLAGSVAHDFNNLLGAIQGFAGFIVEDSPEGDSASHYGQRILMAGKRGKALIGQILSFSRQLDVKRETFSAADLIAETKALLEASLPASTQLRIDADLGATALTGDRDLLGQVLINLCMNANDALGGKPGIVSIRAHAHPSGDDVAARLPVPLGGEATMWQDADGRDHAASGSLDPALPCVSLVVSDSGCGMERRVMEKIFVPFFTTKTREHGTGLGLAAVQRTVLAHHGLILVESRPGEGSSFEIVLPCENGAAAQAADVPPAPHAPNARGGRILLVDDDADFGDMLLTALERRGYDVSPCADPVEALDGLREFPSAWDAMITDQTMPNMSGLELIRAAKALQPGLVCILCTGYAEDALDEATLAEAGAGALFRKPVDVDELAEKLAQHAG